jgi:hypothetical protein
MNEAIASGEVDLLTEPSAKWIAREELMAKALETWSPEVIDAASLLPEGRRLDDIGHLRPVHTAAPDPFALERAVEKQLKRRRLIHGRMLLGISDNPGILAYLKAN